MLDVFNEKYWRMETLPWIFLPSFTCNNKRISLQLHCFVLVFSIGFKGFRTKISPFIKRVEPKLFDATSVIREHFSNWLELNAQRNTIAPSGKKYSSLTNFSMTHFNRGEVVMCVFTLHLHSPRRGNQCCLSILRRTYQSKQPIPATHLGELTRLILKIKFNDKHMASLWVPKWQ